MKKRLLIPLISLYIAGCTSVKVDPISDNLVINRICIEENPRVKVSDFVSVVQQRLRYHNIRSKLVSKANIDTKDCEFVLRYTARRSWDFKPYLSHAELEIYHDEYQIARAVYHLNGGGGLALNKWAGTEAKMNPVIDRLLNKQTN